MSSSFGVFLGLDVGKDAHHAVGLDPDRTRLHDGPLPNTEPKLKALFDKLAEHDPLLVVADQPATTGALPAGHPQLRHQHQGRAPCTDRQPSAQTRVLSLRLRRTV
ncbi:transposase [Amycolatopsis sp. NPDC051758]|uniref:IS110 family transposase n=1 Tax=Amycolatopsis sp. NPDC051758 TaxID=3363935 RepID=UPI00378B80DC